MEKVFRVAIVLLLAAALYLLLWPTSIDPVAWDAPMDRGLVDPYATNDLLKRTKAIDLGDHSGPEDIALGIDGFLYATTRDGAVLRVSQGGDVSVLARPGGRPLGIEVDVDGTIIVANAYYGLQRIARDGSVETLLDEIAGGPLRYADDVAIAADGTIYFSDASTKFGAEQHSGSYEASLLDIMEHGGHGRVISYNPDTDAVQVVADGLNFANGVAVSDAQDFLLIAETGSYRILKHWLRGPASGTTEVLIDNLPGFPDNINNGLNGRYWIGLAAPRNEFLDNFSDKPYVRKIVQRLPAAFRPKAEPSSHVIAINGDGEVLMNLHDPLARFPTLTGVLETRDRIYLTSLFGSQLGVLRKEDM